MAARTTDLGSVDVELLVTVTFLVDLGLQSGFPIEWLKAYVIAWPVAAIMAFRIMPPARRLTEWIVARGDVGAPGASHCHGSIAAKAIAAQKTVCRATLMNHQKQWRRWFCVELS
jgi:hypothetical protein